MPTNLQPKDFILFSSQLISELVNTHARPGTEEATIYKLNTEFSTVLSHLCCAMHYDLLRGEAVECYDPDNHWNEDTAMNMAIGEQDDQEEIFGRSGVGAGLKAMLDHIYENHIPK